MEFVLRQKSLLKVVPTDFIESENVMKLLETKNIYLYKFGDINNNYIEEIENLFDKWRFCFLYFKKNWFNFPFVHTIYSLSSKDIVPPNNVINEYEYSKYFLINGGNCIVRDMIKTDLSNEIFAT